MSTVRIQYQEIPMADVVDYFAKAYTPTSGERVVQYEWFIDPIHAKLVFRLYVEADAGKEGSDEH